MKISERMITAIQYLANGGNWEAIHMRLLMEGTTWTSKDGRTTRIVEMSDGHLCNSIRYVKKLPQDWRREYLPLLEAEVKYRQWNNVTVPRNPERRT